MAKVDGVMLKADSLMLGLNTLAGGKDGGELFKAVKSIRELADDFDKRSGALMADGRRTLGDISRAVNNFDRQPEARVLFGASNNAPAGRPHAGRTAEAGARRERQAAVAATSTRTSPRHCEERSESNPDRLRREAVWIASASLLAMTSL